MRKVTARVLTLALLVVTALVIPGIARAADIQWDGVHGAQNLPCGSDVHWILANAKGVQSATLTVDNAAAIPMDPNKQVDPTQFSVISDTPVDANTIVTATITGTPDGTPFLTISDCAAPATTTTTTTTTTLGNAPGTPNTGFNPLPFVAIGLLLLTGGAVLLRRKTA